MKVGSGGVWSNAGEDEIQVCLRIISKSSQQ